MWSVHAGSLLAFGVASVASRQIPIGPALVLVFLVAVLSASAAGVALGLGLKTLTSFSGRSMASTSGAGAGDPADHTRPRSDHRDGGRVASLLCFVYSGIGLVAIAVFLLIGRDFGADASITLSNLWFLASICLTAAGVMGGSAIMRILPLVRIHDDPFHLFRWFGALTAFSSNAFALIGLLSLGFFGLTIPFGVVPLVGIAAFRRIHEVGSRLARETTHSRDDTGKPGHRTKRTRLENS